METGQPRKTYVRRSRSEINDLLEAFAESGLTQQAFCRDRGVSVATFSSWRRKAQSMNRRDGGDGPSFHPVRLALPSATNEAIAIRLADGTELFFPVQHPAREIVDLITALQRTSSC